MAVGVGDAVAGSEPLLAGPVGGALTGALVAVAGGRMPCRNELEVFAQVWRRKALTGAKSSSFTYGRVVTRF